MNGNLPHLGAEDLTDNTQNIPHIVLLEKRVVLLTQIITGHIDLHVSLEVTNISK